MVTLRIPGHPMHILPLDRTIQCIKSRRPFIHRICPLNRLRLSHRNGESQQKTGSQYHRRLDPIVGRT